VIVARHVEPDPPLRPHERGDVYDQRFERLKEAGVDVHGEANLVERLLRGHGGTRVLDAGCGTGRVAIELARRGFNVTGVDIDPTMLDSARRKAPELRWVLADLATLALGEQFDAVVLAGNVMLFVGPGNERIVLGHVARQLGPGGVLVSGFGLDAGRYTLSDYDDDAAAAGLILVNRYATWDGEPFEGGPYAVSVHTPG
jgi:SAM-dependent methyltransferase